MYPVGLRVQGLSQNAQVLSIGRIAQGRSADGIFTASDVLALMDELALPRPTNTGRTLSKLVAAGHLVRHGSGSDAAFKLTPQGRVRATELVDDMASAALLAEAAAGDLSLVGATGHPVIPPTLAPPELVGPLHDFLDKHPFESNVFGMTRFPANEGDPDPLGEALDVARETCEAHGLTLHLASDRQIVDDLWPNVAAHIWACKYGVAFFEDRGGHGINYNLTLEVGSMIVLGRRLAVLKDETIDQGQKVERLPSDLTGRIYKPVNLDNSTTVEQALRAWITEDLGL